MRNQTSFRLTTTLLPSDTTAKTTTVINKVDAGGNKFYPTFTEETVVLTNDDRTVMETTRATCTDGVLTFVKRGLSDDSSATPIDNRKLTWNPGTLCFITAGASDWIDKDDDITWTGKQTYTDDMVSQGKATYYGLLETKKGVQYPIFPNIETLEAYESPFPGMFAVLESDGELYRYNAYTEQRDVVTTSTPAQPAQATTSTIGTVRGATDTEFNNGTATGSNSELLVATPAQIKGALPVKATTTTIGLVRGATTTEFNNKASTGSDGALLVTTPAQVQGVVQGIGMKAFTLTGTSDTTGGQAILDYYLAGGNPVIKYDQGSQYYPNFYYLAYLSNGHLYFWTITNIGSELYFRQLDFAYSGTTLSSITDRYYKVTGTSS